MEQQIQEYIRTNPIAETALPGLPVRYTIPVVFHLVGNAANNISVQMVLDQLNALNLAYSDMLAPPGAIGSADMQIQFCLAQNCPSPTNRNNPLGDFWSTYYVGTSQTVVKGITRNASAIATQLSQNHTSDATPSTGMGALVNLISFPSTDFLNIWIVDNIYLTPGALYSNILAYAPNSRMLDGVVLATRALGINPSNPSGLPVGRTLVHEVGHYLSLLHTFESGCSFGNPSFPCTHFGDKCCDTPEENYPHRSCSDFSSGCTSSQRAWQNHMSYSDDACRDRFTQNQKERAFAFLTFARSHLVTLRNLQETGVTCTLPAWNNAVTGITYNTQACVGDQLRLTCGYSQGAQIPTFSWHFPVGTTLVSPTVLTPASNRCTVSFSTPGVYVVTATYLQGTVQGTVTFSSIYVNTCPAINTTEGLTKANWYFGNRNALNFASGRPVHTVLPVVNNTPFFLNSRIKAREGSSTISDNSGNLLFYGTNDEIIDNRPVTTTNNVVWTMPIGVNPPYIANDPNFGFTLNSNRQGVAIVPRPGQANKYYFFTTQMGESYFLNNQGSPVNPNTNAPPYGLAFVEVDATAAGANPIAVNGQTLRFPNLTGQIQDNLPNTEPVCVVPHCNGTDYWVMVKGAYSATTTNPNIFAGNPVVAGSLLAYRVTSNGVSIAPVFSPAGFTPTPPRTNITPAGQMEHVGSFEVSPDRRWLAYAGINSFIYIYRFDCNTGTAQLLKTVNTADRANLGICFSPNSRFLYVSNRDGYTQYDLEELSTCTEAVTETYYPLPSKDFGEENLIPQQMQMGPDNRIYITHRAGFNYCILSVINFPDNPMQPSSNTVGINPEGHTFITSGIGNNSFEDLPNLIDGSMTRPLVSATNIKVTYTGCNTACFDVNACGTTYQWNFGDGSAVISGIGGNIPAATHGGATSGDFRYPRHTYPGPGVYTVGLTLTFGTDVRRLTALVSVAGRGTPVIQGAYLVSCDPATRIPLPYYGPPGMRSYRWSVTGGLTPGSTTNTIDIAWQNPPFVIGLTVTDANGCTGEASFPVIESNDCCVANNITPVIQGTSLVSCNAATRIPLPYFGPTGMRSYQWAVSGGLTIGSTTNTIDITWQNPPFVIGLTVTDANGCTGEASFVVAQTNDCCVTNNIYIENKTRANAPIADNSNVYIVGDYTINSTWAGIGINFVMAPDARILVTGDALVKLVNCNFVPCNQMWYGIQAQDGCQITFDNVKVEGALHGIMIGSMVGPPSRLPSSIYLTRCKFFDNGFGITSRTTTSPNIMSGSLNINNSTFSARNYPANVIPYQLPSGSPLFASRGYTNIRTTGVRLHRFSAANRCDIMSSGTTNNSFTGPWRTGIELSNLPVAASIQNARFTNNQTGISANSTVLNVSSSKFDRCSQFGANLTDCISTISGAAFTSANPSFVNCGTAIRAERGRIIANDHFIVGGNRGIEARLCTNGSANPAVRNVGILNNTISVAETGIALYQNEPYIGVVNANRITVTGVPIFSTVTNTPGFVGTCIDITGNLLVNPFMVSVTNNNLSLSNGGAAINMLNTNQNLVEGNTVGFGSANSRGGIELTNSRNNQLSCNSVSGSNYITANTALNNTFSKPFYPGGMVFHQSSGNLVKCNNIAECHTGLLYRETTGSPSTIVSNNFGNNNSSIYFDNRTTLDDQINCGNLFLGQVKVAVQDNSGVNVNSTIPASMPFYGAFTTNSNLIPTIMRIPPNQPPGRNAFSWWSPNNVFQQRCQSATSNFCTVASTGGGGGSGTGGGLSGLVSAANGVLQTQEYEPELNWLAQKELYEKMLNNDSLALMYPELRDFKDSMDLLVRGALQVKEQEKKEAMMATTAETETLEQSNQGIDMILDQLKALDAQMAQVLATTDSAVLATYRDSLMTVLSAKKQVLESVLASYTNLRANKMEQLKLGNDAIETTEAFDLIQQKMQSLWLETIGKGNAELDSAQWETAYYWANQCPLEYGPGVFIARGLVASKLLTHYDDGTNCVAAGFQFRRGHEATVPANTYQLYPNPSTGYQLFHAELPLEEDCQLVYYDAQGRRQASFAVPKGSSLLDVELYLPAAIYYVRLEGSGVHELLGKVVILRD